MKLSRRPSEPTRGKGQRRKGQPVREPPRLASADAKARTQIMDDTGRGVLLSKLAAPSAGSPPYRAPAHRGGQTAGRGRCRA